MVSTLDFESSDPSSNLGGTSIFIVLYIFNSLLILLILVDLYMKWQRQLYSLFQTRQKKLLFGTALKIKQVMEIYNRDKKIEIVHSHKFSILTFTVLGTSKLNWNAHILFEPEVFSQYENF